MIVHRIKFTDARLLTWRGPIHLIHEWRNARKSLDRVHEREEEFEYMKTRRKGLPIQMKTKQSMEMQVVSFVFLEISRQLGSDSCLLMTIKCKCNCCF